MRKRSKDRTGGFWQCLLCCHGNATGLASKDWQRFASTVALSQHRSHYLSEQRESEKKETSFDKITNPRALLMGAAPHQCVLPGNIHEDHIYLWRRGIRIFCPNFFFFVQPTFQWIQVNYYATGLTLIPLHLSTQHTDDKCVRWEGLSEHCRLFRVPPSTFPFSPPPTPEAPTVQHIKKGTQADRCISVRLCVRLSTAG